MNLTNIVTIVGIILIIFVVWNIFFKSPFPKNVKVNQSDWYGYTIYWMDTPDVNGHVYFRVTKNGIPQRYVIEDASGRVIAESSFGNVDVSLLGGEIIRQILFVVIPGAEPFRVQYHKYAVQLNAESEQEAKDAISDSMVALQNLTNMFLSGQISAGEYEAQRESLVNEIERVRMEFGIPTDYIKKLNEQLFEFETENLYDAMDSYIAGKSRMKFVELWGFYSTTRAGEIGFAQIF